MAVSLDLLLWQSMTNLLSVIVTQVGHIVDAAKDDPEARLIGTQRVNTLRQIGEDLVLHADRMHRQLEGEDVEEQELQRQCDEFTEFLQGVAVRLAGD